jgi:hypothetical protein
VYLDIEDPFQTEGVFCYPAARRRRNVVKLKVFALVLNMAALAVTPVLAAAPAQENAAYPSMPPEAGVAYAVASMYAPPAENEVFWSESICSQMTVAGCDYFQREQADILWQSGQGVRADTASRAEVVAEISPQLQVWKMIVTIWKDKEAVYDAYVLVAYSDTRGEWLLERVLYGPTLGFSK